jgi:hypothetical protein
MPRLDPSVNGHRLDRRYRKEPRETICQYTLSKDETD